MGELTPVVTIDGRSIGAGVPGPVTHTIRAAFRDLVADPAYSTPLPDF
jgi:D-alanine transaminase